MDRELKIRMLFEASDRVTRPLREIAGGSRAATVAVSEVKQKLDQLKRTGSDIDAFRKLKADMRGSEAAMEAAQNRVAALARQLRETSNPSRQLTRDFEKAKREAAALSVEHEQQGRSLQQLRDRLRAAGVGTSDLARHERDLRGEIERTNRELTEQTDRLGRADARARRFAAARESFARTQGMATGLAAGGAASIGVGMALARPITGSVEEAQTYESVMTDIAQKANLSRVEAAAMGKNLLAAARAANQLPDALQQGVDTLSGFGLDPRQAIAMMKPIGRAATAYKAEIADLSAAAFAANDNLKVPIQQTGRVIDVMAEAGKQGAFEIKDMAGSFPALTAGYQALGQTGVGAVADLAAALQIARKGAGDSATAATNIANIIQKIASPATIKAFDKMGINLPNALKKAYAEGKTPLEAIAELTRKATGGDLGKIGFLFEDAQVQQGLRPLIQNMEEYRRIRKEAFAASGTTDRDFAERLKDSAERSKQLKIQATTLAIALGTILLPTVNAIVAKASVFATKLADLTQRHPMLTKVALLSAAMMTALFIVLGGGAVVLAALMGPIAVINSGLIAMGVAGGIATIGLWPILAVVLAIVASVALFAGEVYLIYKHWGAISGFFSGLWTGIQTRFASAIDAITGLFRGMWSGVQAIFSMSLLDIYRSLAYFTGFLLGSLARFGSAAWSWLSGTLPGLLVSGFTGAWAMLTTAVSSGVSWLTTRFPAMLANGWNVAWSAFKTAVYAAFVTLPLMFANFGAMIVQGLWNGIKSAPARLFNAGKALAHSLAGGFRAGADIHSPSRVFMALGGHIIGGLNLGLDRGHAGAVGRMARLTRSMAAAAVMPAIALTAPVGAAAEAIGSQARPVRLGARATADAVGTRIREVPNPTASAAAGAIGAVARDVRILDTRAIGELFAAKMRDVRILDTQANAPASRDRRTSYDRQQPGTGNRPVAGGDTYEVHFHPSAGMDEAKLFAMFERWQRDQTSRAAIDRRSSYRDDADGADR